MNTTTSEPDSDERHGVLLRLPKNLHQEIKDSAKSNGRTIHAEILHCIQERWPARTIFGSIELESSPGSLSLLMAKNPLECAELLLNNCIADYREEMKTMATLIQMRVDLVSDLTYEQQRINNGSLGTPKTDKDHGGGISMAELTRQIVDQEIKGSNMSSRRSLDVLKKLHKIRMRAEESWKAYLNLAKMWV